MSSPGNILLLTGTPGIGKTTVVKKVAASLAGLAITGFYTEEIRAQNGRQGFALVTLNGKRNVIAHLDIDSDWRVGKYGVDVAAIDQAVQATLSETCGADLFIIDEIGKMECFSRLFVQKMTMLLDSGKPVVATIALKGNGFIETVKQRPGIVLWEITKKNRESMVVKVLEWVKRRS